MVYAAFAEGATGLPQESWLQLALAGIAALACADMLYGRALRASAPRAAWVGVGLLVAFAAWCGITILWSVTPDRSWAGLNRGLAYALAVVLGIVLGSSLPRAPQRIAAGLAIAAAPVVLYAAAGKTVPGILGLDHAGEVTRLRAPLGYWNALALFCVIALPSLLRIAADAAARRRNRLAALALLHVLLMVVGLTYSRGGILALLVAVAVFLWLAGRERMRALALFGIAGLLASVPLSIALTSADLTTNVLPLERRTDDALIVLVALLVTTALTLAAGLLVMRLERHPAFRPARGRRVGRLLGVVFAALVVLGLINAAATGALGDAVDRFADTKRGDSLTDPNRLLSTNSGNRWAWWQEAAGAWSDKPVAGWGAGSFPVTHRMYRRELLSVQQPHNVPLQFLAETGVVGAALALAALLALVAAALARVRAHARDRTRGYAAALAAVPVAWLAHSLYDWDWDIPAVTLPMLVLLGAVAARPARSRPVFGHDGGGLRGGLLAAAVALLALFCVSALLPALAERRTQSALAAVGDERLDAEGLAEAAADAELAATLNPLAVEPLFAAASIAERRGDVEAARRTLLRALERQPDSVDGWFRLVRLDFTRLDRAALRRETAALLALDPLNPAVAGLARRAQSNSAPPAESATAIGSPLPTEVPVTDPLPAAPIGR